jgi:hypothetical protein
MDLYRITMDAVSKICSLTRDMPDGSRKPSKTLLLLI